MARRDARRGCSGQAFRWRRSWRNPPRSRAKVLAHRGDRFRAIWHTPPTQPCGCCRTRARRRWRSKARSSRQRYRAKSRGATRRRSPRSSRDHRWTTWHPSADERCRCADQRRFPTVLPRLPQPHSRWRADSPASRRSRARGATHVGNSCAAGRACSSPIARSTPNPQAAAVNQATPPRTAQGPTRESGQAIAPAKDSGRTPSAITTQAPQPRPSSKHQPRSPPKHQPRSPSKHQRKPPQRRPLKQEAPAQIRGARSNFVGRRADDLVPALGFGFELRLVLVFPGGSQKALVAVGLGS